MKSQPPPTSSLGRGLFLGGLATTEVEANEAVEAARFGKFAVALEGTASRLVRAFLDVQTREKVSELVFSPLLLHTDLAFLYLAAENEDEETKKIVRRKLSELLGCSDDKDCSDLFQCYSKIPKSNASMDEDSDKVRAHITSLSMGVSLAAGVERLSPTFVARAEGLGIEIKSENYVEEDAEQSAYDLVNFVDFSGRWQGLGEIWVAAGSNKTSLWPTVEMKRNFVSSFRAHFLEVSLGDYVFQTVIPVDDASALDALAKDVDLLEALDQELEGIQKENILAKLSNFRVSKSTDMIPILQTLGLDDIGVATARRDSLRVKRFMHDVHLKIRGGHVAGQERSHEPLFFVLREAESGIPALMGLSNTRMLTFLKE